MVYEAFRNLTEGFRLIPPSDRMVEGERWRVSVLTDSLIRLEWSQDGVFEDGATQMVLNRDLGRPIQARITRQGDGAIIETPALRLEYDGAPFSGEGLSIVVKGVPWSQHNTWHYGDSPRGNLRGTARTLDEADGGIALDEGVLSRDGWSVLDDSPDNVLRAVDEVDGQPNVFGTWPMRREHPQTDLYFFGHGLRFTEAIDDFYRLTGPVPLLPRWALGNWWSRFHRYTQSEYLDLMDRFRREGIPFTVAVLDMDWHMTDVDAQYGSGWTGYTWNRELFPDPRRLLADLHQRGLRVTLNEHPRDGIRTFEDEYAQVAQDMGIDPSSGATVGFDPASPRFMDAYLRMHDRIAADGVDFWWIDWQQGEVTRQRGLDPLWMLNHMQYLASARSGRWPLTFSRYAGIGSHRYPIGFSGDTVVSWESLDFQPGFTATASNIGYGWWSHDIGGHMRGIRDDELEARWYQYGVFSPICRLHSSCSMFGGKEPWNFAQPARSVMTDALRLRHALIPYLHTMNYQAAFASRPLVEPMYWEHPECAAAYEYANEYRFGTELLVAPATRRIDRACARSRTDLWLPHGDWFDFFDGRHYRAAGTDGRSLSVWRPLDRYPVFARSGAIIPMQCQEDGDGTWNAAGNPRHLRVLAFPGDGEFVMSEDCGDWESVRAGQVAHTRMEQIWDEGDVVFIVDAVRGASDAVPSHRDWTIVFRGVGFVGSGPLDGGGEAGRITARVNGLPVPMSVTYDKASLSLSVTVRGVPSADTMWLRIPTSLIALAGNPVEDDVRSLLMSAQMSNVGKDLAYDALMSQGTLGLATVRSYGGAGEDGDDEAHVPDSVMAALEEIMLRL